MIVNEYVLKVRSIVEALAAIDAMPNDDNLVSSTLGGLNNEKAWKSFVTLVYVWKPFHCNKRTSKPFPELRYEDSFASKTPPSLSLSFHGTIVYSCNIARHNI